MIYHKIASNQKGYTLGNNSESIKNIIREECVSIYWKVASSFPIITTIQKKSLPIEREGYNPEKK